MVRQGLVFLISGVFLSSALLTGCDSAGSTPLDFAKTGSAVSISLHSSSPAATNVPPDAVSQPVMLLRVTGSPNQNVDLDALTVTLSGSGLSSSISQAMLHRDNGPGNAGTFDAITDTLVASSSFVGTTATFTILPGITISPGATEDIWVVYTFSPGSPPSGGDTFGAEISSNLDVTVTPTAGGASLDVTGAPVSSELLTVVGRLQIAAGTLTPTTTSHAVSTTNVVMFQILLTAPDEDVLVSSVTFTSTASPGQNSDIVQTQLVVDTNDNGQYDSGVDSPFLGSPQTFTGNTVTFAPNRTVSQGSPQNWLLLFDLGAGHNHGDSFTASIATDSDVAATGQGSGQPVAISLASTPLNGFAQTVSTHGSLTLASGSATPADGGTGSTATDVLMLHLIISESTNIESVTISSLTFAVTGGGSPAGIPQTDIGSVELFLDDGDQSFEPGGGGTDDTSLGTTTVNASNNAVFTIGGGQQIPANGSVEFWVSIDLPGTTTPSAGATFTLRLENTGVTATGDTSSLPPTVLGGPVNARTVSIVPVGTMTVAASANQAPAACVDRTLPNHAALVLTLTAGASEGVNVTNITLTASGTGLDNSHISSVDVYVDLSSPLNGLVDVGTDTQLGSGTFNADNGTASITVNRTIAASASEDWIVALNWSTSTPPWVGLTYYVSLSNNND
ncbi:MAG: hypothetical protein ACYTFG_21725, partial [Planctomycetota bacterium]